MSIPILSVSGSSIADAYERALIELWMKGEKIKSQYDKPDDPPTVDARMSIVIENPWSDPMIHKAFPGGVSDLREYVYELMGYKDSWVRNMNDDSDKRWEYTYHQRLASYGTWYELQALKHYDDESHKNIRVKSSVYANDEKSQGINQVEAVIQQLIASPYTRRAQAITWMPNFDSLAYDPPCLQSLWYRMTEEDDVYKLHCDVRFRSNDAWQANFMNMFGFVHFNRVLIADEIQKRTGKKVDLGSMWWVVDSFHIYGKDQKNFEEMFWKRWTQTTFAERTYNFFSEEIQEMWKESDEPIMKKIAEYDAR